LPSHTNEKRCVTEDSVAGLGEAGGPTSPNHHCGGGVYGATCIGAPYETGAVAQGSQGGGHAGAHGGGHGGGQAGAQLRRSQLQQQQPLLLTATARSAASSVIFFIASVSLRVNESVESFTASDEARFDAGAALAMAKIGHSTLPRSQRCANATVEKTPHLLRGKSARSESNNFAGKAVQASQEKIAALSTS